MGHTRQKTTKKASSIRPPQADETRVNQVGHHQNGALQGRAQSLVIPTKEVYRITENGHKRQAVDAWKVVVKNIRGRFARAVQKETQRLSEALERATRELHDAHELIKRKNKRLRKLAITDSLTGLYNHRHIHELLTRTLLTARRYRQPLSCIMIDIDHFKKFNDRYGHMLGDRVLERCAGILRENLREADIIGRYGGEEFLVVLPNTPLGGARLLAQRIRRAIANQRFGGMSAGVTVSLGVTALARDKDFSPEEFFKAADEALYQAKKMGRNRVCTGTA